MDSSLEVDGVGVIDVNVAVGEEEERAPHQYGYCRLSQPIVGQHIPHEEGELTEEFHCRGRVVINKHSINVILLYFIQIFRSFLSKIVPSVFENVEFLDGEVEIFVISSVDALFELLKVMIPIFD